MSILMKNYLHVLEKTRAAPSVSNKACCRWWLRWHDWPIPWDSRRQRRRGGGTCRAEAQVLFVTTPDSRINAQIAPSLVVYFQPEEENIGLFSLASLFVHILMDWYPLFSCMWQA
jgi:hypothetical protein